MSTALSELQRQQVLASLEHILNSKPFTKAKRQQALLSYIVHAAVDGKTDKINGYQIAINVFKRPSDFDPQTDTLVRVAAGRLRTKLTAYYDEQVFPPEVTISLPVRSYVPTLTFKQPRQQAPTVTESSTPSKPNKAYWPVLGTAALVTLALVLSDRFYGKQPTNQSIADAEQQAGKKPFA